MVVHQLPLVNGENEIIFAGTGFASSRLFNSCRSNAIKNPKGDHHEIP
jgi:hypothetical protein